MAGPVNKPDGVTTAFVYPPIPVRDHDWRATWDHLDENGPQGWGATEQAAIDDLIKNYPLEETE